MGQTRGAGKSPQKAQMAQKGQRTIRRARLSVWSVSRIGVVRSHSAVYGVSLYLCIFVPLVAIAFMCQIRGAGKSPQKAQMAQKEKNITGGSWMVDNEHNHSGVHGLSLYLFVFVPLVAIAFMCQTRGAGKSPQNTQIAQKGTKKRQKSNRKLVVCIENWRRSQPFRRSRVESIPLCFCAFCGDCFYVPNWLSRKIATKSTKGTELPMQCGNDRNRSRFTGISRRSQDELPYLESCSAEVDQHSVTMPRRPEIAQRLSDMFPDQSPGSLELQYKAVFDVQIRYEGAQERTVFIVHL